MYIVVYVAPFCGSMWFYVVGILSVGCVGYLIKYVDGFFPGVLFLNAHNVGKVWRGVALLIF